MSLMSSSLFADFMITQSDTETAYTGNSVDFEDAPTGVNMDPFDFYQASNGITFTSGNGFMVASNWDDTDGIDGGASPGGIQLAGGFQVNMQFEQDVTELSWQGWADGQPAFPFGGINVFVFNDGVEVAAYFGDFAPFGGVGDEWFNVVATGGDSFDEIRFFNPSFQSFSAYVDNISFNNVPEPGTFGLLSIVGLVVFRRRR
jgi:hypothetical protein